MYPRCLASSGGIYTSFGLLAYVSISHHPNLSKMSKHWGSFLTHCRNQGRWDEAQKLLMEMMKEEKLASSHPDSHQHIQHGSDMGNEGRLNEAEKLGSWM